MITMDELKNKIRGALGDPKAPWYGSDLVAWVGDYIEEAERQLDNARDCLWGKKAGYVKELEADLKAYRESFGNQGLLQKAEAKIAELEKQIEEWAKTLEDSIEIIEPRNTIGIEIVLSQMQALKGD